MVAPIPLRRKEPPRQTRRTQLVPSSVLAMLIFVIILVAALNFIPALALGPLATELSGQPF